MRKFAIIVSRLNGYIKTNAFEVISDLHHLETVTGNLVGLDFLEISEKVRYNNVYMFLFKTNDSSVDIGNIVLYIRQHIQNVFNHYYFSLVGVKNGKPVIETKYRLYDDDSLIYTNVVCSSLDKSITKKFNIKLGDNRTPQIWHSPETNTYCALYWEKDKENILEELQNLAMKNLRHD